MRQPRCRESQRCLIRTGVDLTQNLALLNEIAFVEIDLHQLPVDARLDRDRIESGNVTETVQINRNAGTADFCYDYRHRPERRTSASAAAASTAAVLGSRHQVRLSGAPDRIARNADDNQQKKSPH